MIVKRVVKFNIKKNHVDYNYIKQQLIESKEIYNYANYVIRQIFFKKSKNNKYNMDFVNEYVELKDLFLNYIEEDKQFTSLFYKIIRKFAKLKEFSINTKIIHSIIRRLKADWDSYWALLNLAKNKQYDKLINIPKYKKQYNLVEYDNQVLSKKKLKFGFIGTDKMKQGIKISNFHKYLKNKKLLNVYVNDDVKTYYEDSVIIYDDKLKPDYSFMDNKISELSIEDMIKNSEKENLFIIRSLSGKILYVFSYNRYNHCFTTVDSKTMHRFFIDDNEIILYNVKYQFANKYEIQEPYELEYHIDFEKYY